MLFDIQISHHLTSKNMMNVNLKNDISQEVPVHHKMQKKTALYICM